MRFRTLGLFFPIRNMQRHQALEKLAMVSHAQVKKLVDNHVVLQVPVQLQEIFTEHDAAMYGARSPLFPQQSGTVGVLFLARA